MRLTLAQLEAFYWTHRLRGINPAARHLHLAQPTVSARLRELERNLGARLFVRNGRGIQPTAEANGLLERADEVLAMARRITGQKLEHDPLRFGLRLGGPDSFALVCMPLLLAAIEVEYPELEVALAIENSAVLNRMLKDNELDFAFLARPHLDSSFKCEPLGFQDIGWFASRSLRLPSRVLKPHELSDLHIITNPHPSPLYGVIHDWFQQSGIRQPRISTCNNLSVIASMTAAGSAICVLPSVIVRQQVKSGTMRRLKTEPALNPQAFFAAYRANAAGRGVDVVTTAARRVIRQTKFLLSG